jgi:hypothetical protein
MTDTNRFYFTDTATATLEYSGEGTLTTDDFSPSDAETTTRDDAWADFFDNDEHSSSTDSSAPQTSKTMEFVQFDATIAQPIVQPYFHDGEIRYFKKDAGELRQAQAQLKHLPWTMGHPDDGRVTDTAEIRGFWTDPEYDDGQHATLNIPTNDPEAIRYAVDNSEVSVGFSGVLDWVDDPDTKYDAVQRNMAYDHVASVEDGRCSTEDGCGIHTDSDADIHGHVFEDAIRSQTTEEGDVSGESDWSDGDWVWFNHQGERRHGQVTEAEAGRTLIILYDEDEQELTDEVVLKASSSVHEWVGPFTDSCPGDTCHCGCHTGVAQSTDQQTTDTTDITDSMTTIHEFIDENDLEKEDVLDSLGVEVPDEPTYFYDGQPSADELAEDFDAVDLLMDSKEDLEEKVENLTDSLEAYEEQEAEAKIEELTDLTDNWDGDELREQYENDEITLDRLDERIEIAEDMLGSETTTVEDQTDSADDTTEESGGRHDLREKTKV